MFNINETINNKEDVNELRKVNFSVILVMALACAG